jgi:hypothetical protein
MLYWLGKHPNQPVYTIPLTTTRSDDRPTVGPTQASRTSAEIIAPDRPLSRKLMH